jgi:hypothetical protein
MCGMSRNNDRLVRIDGDYATIRKQLEILYYREELRWVMILSGEYRKGAYRSSHLSRVIWTVNEALMMGFERVTLNIGALDEGEIAMIRHRVIYPERLGLAIFQETYNRELYHKAFGSYSEAIPKSDYDGRLRTAEEWLKSGFGMVNLGILLGIGNFEEDVKELIRHATDLREGYSAMIQISLPRIVGDHRGCSDNELIGIIRRIRQKIPWAEIIITTREEKELITKMLPYIDIVSPGTSEVLGYREEGPIGNDPDKSQFFINEVRERPSEILSYFQQNNNIEFNYWKGGSSFKAPIEMKEQKEQCEPELIFLSTPITNAIIPETGCLSIDMTAQIKMIADKIRQKGYRLFLAIEIEQWGKVKATPEEITPRDYNNLLQSNRLVVYLTECFSEGTLVEIGWASANQIPTTIICPKNLKISPLIKGLNCIGDNRIYYVDFGNTEEIDVIFNERL